MILDATQPSSDPKHDLSSIEAWCLQTFGLSGRIAVVTGGSRGIGRMIAEGMLNAGAHVVICSRDATAGLAAAEELGRLGEVTFIAADLATETGCRDFAAKVGQLHATVDILVNNAGATWGAAIEEYPEMGWDKVMALNVKAAFMLTKHMLPSLQASATREEPARVLNIGSIEGLVVSSMSNYAYSASKAAVHHLTRTLARDLASRHILVNAIAPGPYESKMMAQTLVEHGDEVAASSPLGRIGRPLDVAAAAVYLAGRGSTYVTGVILPVDGGIATTSG